MSQGHAQRRIDCARLIREFPDLRVKVQSGEFNLTHASLARRHFRNEAKFLGKSLSANQKKDVISKLCGTSAREAQRMIAELSTQPEVNKEFESALSKNRTSVRMIVSDELKLKARRLKEIWAHALPGSSWTDLVGRAFDIALAASDPLLIAQREVERREMQSARMHVTCKRKSQHLSNEQTFSNDQLSVIRQSSQVEKVGNSLPPCLPQEPEFDAINCL
jgi:hypothetical protein